MTDRYIRIKTLADEMGMRTFPVKRSLVNAGYKIHKVAVNGRQRDAVTVQDAKAWRSGLNTPMVR